MDLSRRFGVLKLDLHQDLCLLETASDDNDYGIFSEALMELNTRISSGPIPFKIFRNILALLIRGKT